MGNFRQSLFIITVFLVSSCSHTGIVNDAAVKLVKPDKVVSMTSDTTLRCAFVEVLNCYLPRIVNDTILVLQDQISENNPYYFKAYSTNTFDYLGSFVRKGRGPGELFSPHVTNDDIYKEYLSVNDNQTGKAYILDVEESIENQRTTVVKSFELPSNVVAWLPLSDSGQFTFQLENRELIFHAKGSDGVDFKKINLYKGVDGERYVTHLSSILVNNKRVGKVAEAMVLFPQINIIDTVSGQVHSIAVDKNYRKWKSVLDRMIDMSTIEYYVGATSTSDYIFAVYKCHPIGMLNGDTNGSSIHVFDWDGNFLYEIKVPESIGNITFDSRTKFLYCVAKPENRIVRYDLSGLL